jgi:hypothetical protein
VWLSKTGELSTSGCNPPSYTPAPVTSDTCAMLVRHVEQVTVTTTGPRSEETGSTTLQPLIAPSCCTLLAAMPAESTVFVCLTLPTPQGQTCSLANSSLPPGEAASKVGHKYMCSKQPTGMQPTGVVKPNHCRLHIRSNLQRSGHGYGHHANAAVSAHVRSLLHVLMMSLICI